MSETLTICTTVLLPCRLGSGAGLTGSGQLRTERSVMSEHNARFASANDVANAAMKCMFGSERKNKNANERPARVEMLVPDMEGLTW